MKILNAGINCIEYKDGRRVNIDDYAQMALRTAATKAYMQGEARKKDEMGIDTVLISQYGACSETCLPWQGRVYIDDVWGSAWKERALTNSDATERRENVPKINLAKAIDFMSLVNGEEGAKYSREEILQELQQSPIGKDTIRAITSGNARIDIYDTPRNDGVRGDQLDNEIRIFSRNIKNTRIAGQTVIHEMAHFRFNIGGCQHAEAICFAMEKMHIMGRDYLTPEEWEYVKKLAIDNYPEYNWEKGGYGDYEQFSFVKSDQ